MSPSSNHEKTTIAVREEVERAIGNSVPQNKRNAVAERVERVFEKYSSPYPDPRFLGDINAICPGAADKIIDAAIEDLRHRQEVEKSQIELKSKELTFLEGITGKQVASVSEGRRYGFSAYIACLIFSAVTYGLGSETLALAGFGAAAIGIIAQLIRGGSTGISITKEQGDDAADTDKKV